MVRATISLTSMSDLACNYKPSRRTTSFSLFGKRISFAIRAKQIVILREGKNRVYLFKFGVFTKMKLLHKVGCWLDHFSHITEFDGTQFRAKFDSVQALARHRCQD